MASYTKAIAAGNAYAFLGFIDSSGFMIGSNPTAPASGATGSPMRRILGIKSASPSVPEPETVAVTGDDIQLGEFAFDSIAQRSFVIEVAVQDLDAEAALLGTTVQTLGEVRVGALDIIGRPELNVALIIQSRTKKQDAGAVGQAGWGGVIIPLATAIPLGRAAFEERAAAVFRYQITPQIASSTPLGETILPANFGTTGLRYMPFTSENPIVMHAHTGNGVLTTFNLEYAPISDVKFAAYSNRVAQTVTAVSSTSPYSVTLSGAPANNARVVSLYEFTP